MRFTKKCAVSIKSCYVNGKAVVLGIVIVLFCGILSRILSGSPVYMLRLTSLYGKIPKSWFFILWWTIWYIALGFCFGFALGTSKVTKTVCKYKGSLWFVIMMVFNIIWYPLFFKAGTVFLALADAALIIFFCLLSSIEYLKLNKLIGTIMFAHLGWLIWCFLINLKAFLCI